MAVPENIVVRRSQTAGSYSKSLYGYGKGSGKDIETSLAEVRAEKEAAKKGTFSSENGPSTFSTLKRSTFSSLDRPLFVAHFTLAPSTLT